MQFKNNNKNFKTENEFKRINNILSLSKKYIKKKNNPCYTTNEFCTHLFKPKVSNCFTFSHCQ